MGEYLKKKMEDDLKKKMKMEDNLIFYVAFICRYCICDIQGDF